MAVILVGLTTYVSHSLALAFVTREEEYCYVLEVNGLSLDVSTPCWAGPSNTTDKWGRLGRKFNVKFRPVHTSSIY